MAENNGSALILVLWTLVLIGFLAGEYLEHNRGKACLALNAWDSLKQKEAVESMLSLFATDSLPIPTEDSRKGTWDLFSPGGIDLWVSVNNESKRININTAQDSQIRDKILKLPGEVFYDEADWLADAVDWMVFARNSASSMWRRCVGWKRSESPTFLECGSLVVVDFVDAYHR